MAHWVCRNSTIGDSEDSVLRNSNSGVSEDPRAQQHSTYPYWERGFWCRKTTTAGSEDFVISGVSEDPRAQRYSTYPYWEGAFWCTGCTETPLPQFLKITYSGTPVMEFLRIPVRNDSTDPYRERGFWRTGCTELHWQSF